LVPSFVSQPRDMRGRTRRHWTTGVCDQPRLCANTTQSALPTESPKPNAHNAQKIGPIPLPQPRQRWGRTKDSTGSLSTD